MNDGGFEIREGVGCLMSWYQAVMVNGERCYSSYYGEPMKNRPEAHYHLTRGEAEDCAMDRLKLGMTLETPR